MVDFLMISTRSRKRGTIEIYPSFIIGKSQDLMIRGGDFYAIWLEERGLWSTDEQDALQLIDRELDRFAKEHENSFEEKIKVLHLWDAETGMIDVWHKYCQKQCRDSFNMLDEKLIFNNVETVKKDYASKKLNYPLAPCDITSYDKLMSTLYSEKERHKIEWAIGSIVCGDSKKLQKFMVLYGAAGTGKSTVLNIIQQLFEGYYSVFDAKALGSSNNSFALESFKSNPLVAIQHDGDLSRIEDNTRLNSLVSHEIMTVNEKFKATYASHFKCFLFMGTNKPVKITDAKSGLIRRLIDVSPTGNKIPIREYRTLVNHIPFELGGIAHHCQNVYLSNVNAYDDYVPMTMLGASNDFYNFVNEYYFMFKKEDNTTLKAAWELYKTYCDDAKVGFPLPQRSFKEELKNYFKDYKERLNLEDGTRIRSLYSGFRIDKFEEHVMPEEPEKKQYAVKLEVMKSRFDTEFANEFAQYATENDIPSKKWENVTTKLKDLDTSKVHFVLVPENHVIIDFDILDKDGNKDLHKNLEEASKWPPTYTELSKSGKGVHLHYNYSGDISKVSGVYDDHIEVKVFSGKSALRRKLSKCNNLPVMSISSGLPLKGEKMVSVDQVRSEKALRNLINRNFNKEIHPGTKPSIDFIYKILDDAYNSDLKYDVSDMYNDLFTFAVNSTNQSDTCIKIVNNMKLKSKETEEIKNTPSSVDETDDKFVFFDVEVFPNLFICNWKFQGKENPVIRMINPKPVEIEDLLRYKLIGFNNRRYDNHILYARLIGYTNEQLFELSHRIVIDDDSKCLFGEAYNLSYTDIYDFCSEKKSLKKWEIELGIHHKELGLPWDQPVPEDKWQEAAEYCENDVLATEAVFDARKSDFVARQILADLADMTVNDTTNSLTTKIIFGKERRPKLVYTNLATGEQTGEDPNHINAYINAFPGYEFVYSEKDKQYHNMFRGVDLGKGGYVYAEPGIYGDAAVLDVESQHPRSAIAMNCFGEYTQKFEELLNTRLAIKHGDFDAAKKIFSGRLDKYLSNKEDASALSQALKIAINSVYGLTAAKFDNTFRDPRNTNNIVALRGALFMKSLQDEVQSRGFTVLHIKTDSIKIANATPEIIHFCMEFAKGYGYTFEHEATYDKICLVNEAVFIAQYASKEKCEKLYGYVPKNNGKTPSEWSATGTQFAIPYVFKSIFTKEPITFNDLCTTMSVTTSLYLDFNEGLPNVEIFETVNELRNKIAKDGIVSLSKKNLALINEWGHLSDEELNSRIDAGHDYRFVGRVGNFCPIKEGCGGALLLRQNTNNTTGLKTYASATGSKGYRWLESEMVQFLKKEKDIDRSYYENMVFEAYLAIKQYADPDWFLSDKPYNKEDNEILPF